MSLLRIGPDPAGENVNTAYQVSPDYDGFGWAQSIDYAKYALSCNPSLLIFATPYSAPNTMTSNGTFFAGSLLPADYSAYGSWLQSYNSYASSNGVPLYAISLQNEPDAPSTYIGYTTWSAAQFDSWFAGDNGSAITTKVMFPEGCCSGSTYADTTLEDSNAAVMGDISPWIPTPSLMAFRSGCRNAIPQTLPRNLASRKPGDKPWRWRKPSPSGSMAATMPTMNGGLSGTMP
jgi:O-glycosyl hydrolase